MSLFLLCLSAIIGGIIFYLIHWPLAWLLGPMIATILFIKVSKQTPKFPFSFRNYGLIPIGYTIGLNFDQQTLMDMGTHLPSMLMMTLFLLGFSVLLAYISSKITHSNLKSTIAGSIPGGLTQMVAISSEIKGIDLTVVTIIQVCRIITVILFVPILVYSPILHGKEGIAPIISKNPVSYEPLFILFLVIAYFAGILAKKGRFPTPFMLGPLMVIAIFILLGLDVPHLPVSLVSLAQILIGIDLGYQVKFGNIDNKPMFLTVSILSSIFLVAFTLLNGLLLIKMEENITFLTAFIGLAPGGMAEMAILGQTVQEDLAIITTYQLFRLLFILFCVPPMMKVVFLYLSKEKKKLPTLK